MSGVKVMVEKTSGKALNCNLAISHIGEMREL